MDTLQAEMEKLKKFDKRLGTASEYEAYTTFLHILANNDQIPARALHYVHESNAIESVTSTDASTACPLSVKGRDGFLNGSVIKVPALPWTDVAGDEVVSQLMFQYFTFDYLHGFPPIPCSIFLSEMQTANPATAFCCSALLVNAICARQCVSLNHTPQAGAMRSSWFSSFFYPAF